MADFSRPDLKISSRFGQNSTDHKAVLHQPTLGPTADISLPQYKLQTYCNNFQQTYVNEVSLALRQHDRNSAFRSIAPKSTLQQSTPDIDLRQHGTGVPLISALQQNIRYVTPCSTSQPYPPDIDLKQHMSSSVSTTSIYKKSNLCFTNRLSDKAIDLSSLPPIDLKICGAVNLFFADMFWCSLKRIHPEYPLWHMIESLRKDFPSLWTEEITTKVNISFKQYYQSIHEHLLSLTWNIQYVATGDPTEIGQVFSNHVLEVASWWLQGDEKNKRLLKFCAYVREMFLSCIDNTNFPINFVILSIAVIVCKNMEWKTLKELYLFIEYAKFG